jgi:hypothetical protein
MVLPSMGQLMAKSYAGIISCDKGILEKNGRNVKQPNNSPKWADHLK